MEAIRDALWNKPEGGISTSKDRLNYPAVHVSYEDAYAFCSLKGMRLPSEVEWEYAARGSLTGNFAILHESFVVIKIHLGRELVSMGR